MYYVRETNLNKIEKKGISSFIVFVTYCSIALQTKPICSATESTQVCCFPIVQPVGIHMFYLF